MDVQREMPKLDRRQIEEADRQKRKQEPEKEKDGKTDLHGCVLSDSR